MRNRKPATRDRLKFEEVRLANGIRAFHYGDKSRFTVAIISTPVGLAHTSPILTRGTAHFLEHMTVDEHLRRDVGLKGGEVNASTGLFNTQFSLDIPTSHFNDFAGRFVTSIFHPDFSVTRTSREQGVILSERRTKSRWYPGVNEVSHYLQTKWQDSQFVTLDQRLGTDRDLDNMTADKLRHAHQAYYSPDVWVVTAGGAEPYGLWHILENLPVTSQVNQIVARPLKWVNSDYHEVGFRDLDEFGLRYGGILEHQHDPKSMNILTFILQYLTNSVHGVLWEWLRMEKGWIYGLNTTNDHIQGFSHDWQIKIWMRDLRHVHAVRDELEDRIRQALHNEAAINAEVDRLLCKLDAYMFPTVGQSAGIVCRDVQKWGRIFLEAELVQWFEAARDPTYLQKVWDEYTKPDRVGMCCTTPL